MQVTADSRRLSVAVLADDDADALRGSLSSVHGVADEMIVVNPNLFDGIAEAAGQFGGTSHRPLME